MKYWYTPPGSIPGFSLELLNGYHALIAGATGSGKSVIINHLIFDLLLYAPPEKKLILIDPKRVELSIYKNLPHCIIYANNAKTIPDAIEQAYNLMVARFAEMEKQQIKTYNGATVYIIIDEFTDLKFNYPETIEKIILLSSMGRAAKIILILATQRPTRDILNGAIQANFSTRCALRCDSLQDSKNIIGCSGAEKLPLFGYGILKSPNYPQPQQFNIPIVSEQEIKNRVEFWLKQK